MSDDEYMRVIRGILAQVGPQGISVHYLHRIANQLKLEAQAVQQPRLNDIAYRACSIALEAKVIGSTTRSDFMRMAREGGFAPRNALERVFLENLPIDKLIPALVTVLIQLLSSKGGNGTREAAQAARAALPRSSW